MLVFFTKYTVYMARLITLQYNTNANDLNNFRREKMSLSALFDRESRREKILEGIAREKQMVKKKGVLGRVKHFERLRTKKASRILEENDEDPISKAEREFFEEIERTKLQREINEEDQA